METTVIITTTEAHLSSPDDDEAHKQAAADPQASASGAARVSNISSRNGPRSFMLRSLTSVTSYMYLYTSAFKHSYS